MISIAAEETATSKKTEDEFQWASFDEFPSADNSASATDSTPSQSPSMSQKEGAKDAVAPPALTQSTFITLKLVTDDCCSS
jgi:hypothetical protein